MDITYLMLCQRIASYDFNWDDLAELMVDAASKGEVDLNFDETNRARMHLVKALRSILPGIGLKSALDLVKDAEYAAVLPTCNDAVKSQAIRRLQRLLDDDYHTMFVNGIPDDDLAAEAALDADTFEFGVCRFHYGKVEYLAVTPAHPIWVESINAATRLDLPIANALRVFYSSYLEAEGPCSEHGCYIIAFS